MLYAFFYELCPELAESETRTITILDDSSLSLPAGDYSLLEMFCNERKCDCRRVFFYVVSSLTDDVVAVIAWGWESKKFYAKWMRDDDPEVIKELQGPMLNIGSPQSSLAPAILDLVNDIILNDRAYVERIKTHYLIYRSKVERRTSSKRRRGKLKLRR
jgi:hypothetical protein